MLNISNAEAKEMQRLLGVLQALNGKDDRTRNIQRRASLLKRRLERKTKKIAYQ